MRLGVLLLALIAPLSGVEYSYRDVGAMRTMEAVAQQMGVELYVDPGVVDSLADLRLTMQGTAATYDDLLSGVCREIGRLVTKREAASLDAGEQVVILHQFVEHDGRRLLLARRVVKNGH